MTQPIPPHGASLWPSSPRAEDSLDDARERAVRLASVKFMVARGIMVDFDVGAFMAAAGIDERAVNSDVHAPPHLRIRGTACMAEVRVRVRDRER